MDIWTPKGRIFRLFFDEQLRPRYSVIAGIWLVTLIWGTAIFVASFVDTTLTLPNAGRGLLDHFGFQACLVSAPLVLSTGYIALSHFFRLLRQIDSIVVDKADSSDVEAIINPHMESLCLKGPWKGMLGLFIIIGVGASIAIFAELGDPTKFWGNDVFNAPTYKYGFVAANSFLFVLWAVVYPVCVFYALHLTISSEMIVAGLKRKDLLQLDFLHVDKCGGMSKFGTLNFIVMLIYLWLFAVAFALHSTHQSTYLSLMSGGIAASAAFVIQSVYGIYWVARAISSERDKFVTTLNNRIRSTVDGKQSKYTAAIATLEYRDRVIQVSSFPYSRRIYAAVNVLRYGPALVTLTGMLANFRTL